MITIVGAGLVGSLWALLLRQQGFEVQMFERRPDPRLQTTVAGRSINLVLTSRGLYALAQAGLMDKVRALAVPVFGRIIHPVQGDTVYQAYGQQDEFNLSISRGDLNRFLLEEALQAGVKIHFEHDLNNLEPAAKKVHFKTPAGIRSYNYEILFGTDGSSSRVRKQLAQIFSGSFQESTEWLEADYKELSLPRGSGLRTDGLHIWPRGAHMLMGLANQDGSFTMTVYLPKKASPEKSWSFDRAQSKAEVEALFKHEFPDALSLMPDYLSEFIAHPQGSLGTVRCSRWVFEDSIALLGDAAHGIVPFFGQGMNSGFEDCTVLLELLRARISNQSVDWASLLKDFETRQKPNADAIAEMALENWVEMRDKVGDPKFLLRKKVESILEQKHPGVFKSRYGMITYTLVPYSVAQAAGLVQSQMIDRLIEAAQSLEQVSWSQVEELLLKQWLPFVQEYTLQLQNYPPK